MSVVSNEELFKEIDLIQNCIERMAKNSFMIKGWSLTIFAGILAFLNGDLLKNQLLIACALIIPFIGFWYIDSCFLLTEKCYRSLYKQALSKRKAGSREAQYDLDPCGFKNTCGGLWNSFWSKTLICFYGTQILIVSIIILYSIYYSI